VNSRKDNLLETQIQQMIHLAQNLFLDKAAGVSPNVRNDTVGASKTAAVLNLKHRASSAPAGHVRNGTQLLRLKNAAAKDVSTGA
jgi:hypothetical protein